MQAKHLLSFIQIVIKEQHRCNTDTVEAHIEYKQGFVEFLKAHEQEATLLPLAVGGRQPTITFAAASSS